MLAAWWTGNGEDTWYVSQFDSATVDTDWRSFDMWDWFGIRVDHLYQRGYHYGANQKKLDSGYFYLLNTADDSETPAAAVAMTAGQRLLPEPDSNADIIYTNGWPTEFWLPMVFPVSGPSQYLSVYMTADPKGDIANWGPFHLYHYQPWSWFGRPAAIIASLLMRLGIDQDFIDTGSFDDSYDEQEVLGGLIPQTLFVSREFGRKPADLIKEVCRHCQDTIGYTMDGKFGMFSRTSPTYSGSVDSIISITNTSTSKHLCNTLRLTYGQVTRQVDRAGNRPTILDASDNEIPNVDYIDNAKWEQAGESQADNNWVVEATNSTSITAYGEIPLGGVVIEADDDGNTISVPVTHFRFFPNSLDMELVTDRIDYEGTELREITITQNFLGLDYEVGTVLAGEDLTGDADTPFYLRCIKKTIDFNRMTVTSVLLETSVT
jgi:hypothetical protein